MPTPRQQFARFNLVCNTNSGSYDFYVNPPNSVYRSLRRRYVGRYSMHHPELVHNAEEVVLDFMDVSNTRCNVTFPRIKRITFEHQIGCKDQFVYVPCCEYINVEIVDLTVVFDRICEIMVTPRCCLITGMGHLGVD